MKKLILLLIMFTSAFAIDSSNKCQEPDVCCEMPTDCFAFYYPMDTGVACPRKFDFGASFLWMGFYQAGLEYAILINSDIQKRNEISFNPGFRVEASYHNKFSFEAKWTYIRFKEHDFASASGDLLGLYYPPNAGTLTGANSTISGDFNVMDLDFSKPYHVSKSFVSKPKIGIQAAWIDEDYHIRYFVTNQKQDVLLKNDFRGIGLKAGLDASCIIGKNFGFYGNFDTAILFSKFDVSQDANNVSIYNYSFTESMYTVIPNAKIGIGMSYAKFFANRKTKVMLKVGYELQNWWAMNRFKRPMDSDPVAFKDVARGSLTFNGLVATLHIDI